MSIFQSQAAFGRDEEAAKMPCYFDADP